MSETGEAKTIGEIDHTIPGGKWAFDEGVTKVFDDMIRRSIPGYDQMREIVFSIGRRFVEPNTDVVDLGAAHGEAIAPFVEKFGALNRYVAVEVSEPMRDVLNRRFDGLIRTKLMRVQDLDLRMAYPTVKASLTLSIFTLQFIPIEYRQRLLDEMFRATVPGGAVVIAEKVLGETSKSDALLVDAYYEMKRSHGYTEEEIQRKRLALEGVLVPITERWNELALAKAGFGSIQPIWRHFNFCAIVAVRP